MTRAILRIKVNFVTRRQGCKSCFFRCIFLNQRKTNIFSIIFNKYYIKYKPNCSQLLIIMICGDCDNNFVFTNAQYRPNYAIIALCILLFLFFVSLNLKNKKKQLNQKTKHLILKKNLVFAPMIVAVGVTLLEPSCEYNVNFVTDCRSCRLGFADRGNDVGKCQPHSHRGWRLQNWKRLKKIEKRLKKFTNSK